MSLFIPGADSDYWSSLQSDCRKMSYLIQGDQAIRFQTPGSTWNNIKIFDHLDQQVQPCFLCHKRVPSSEIAIMWMGAGDDIWFHPTCARSFVLRLARDVWEWECKSRDGILTG